MPNPTYRPKSYLRYPGEFGRNPAPELRASLGTVEEAGISHAALLQSKEALEVRRRLVEHGVSRDDFAQGVGMHYDRVSRLLTGEIVMKLEDIGRFNHFFAQFENEDDEDFI